METESLFSVGKHLASLLKSSPFKKGEKNNRYIQMFADPSGRVVEGVGVLSLYRLLGFRVPVPPRAWMCVINVLLGRDLCVWLITSPGESYRV
jgi:hypothetical protein